MIFSGHFGDHFALIEGGVWLYWKVQGGDGFNYSIAVHTTMSPCYASVPETFWQYARLEGRHSEHVSHYIYVLSLKSN
jgi:hypothetical protein